MPRHVAGAKVALLDFNLQKHRLQLGVQVLVTNPKELEAIRQREAEITKKNIATIIAAGANVILTHFVLTTKVCICVDFFVCMATVNTSPSCVYIYVCIHICA